MLADQTLRLAGDAVQKHGPFWKVAGCWHIILMRNSSIRAWDSWPFDVQHTLAYPFWWIGNVVEYRLILPVLMWLLDHDILYCPEGYSIFKHTTIWFAKSARKDRREYKARLFARINQMTFEASDNFKRELDKRMLAELEARRRRLDNANR